MQNVETDINKESNTAKQQVSVREPMTDMREQRMVDESAARARRREYLDHNNELLAKYAGASKQCQMPHAQRFYRQQRDVRSEFRGQTMPVSGADDARVPPRSSHTPEMIAMHKQNARGLPHHIVADPVKAGDDAVDNIHNIRARELRARVLAARKREMLLRDSSGAVPHTLARPLAVNCREAERDEALKTYTEGNEEAYKVVEQLNAAAMGYKDTAENGAQKQADAFNARQRQAAVAKQTNGAGIKYAGQAAAAAAEENV